MPPTWNDGMLESWNNGQKRIISVFRSRFFRSMVCLSQKPYYFSTRWNTNGPNIPLFHYSPPPADERSELSSISFDIKFLVSTIKMISCVNRIIVYMGDWSKIGDYYNAAFQNHNQLRASFRILCNRCGLRYTTRHTWDGLGQFHLELW